MDSVQYTTQTPEKAELDSRAQALYSNLASDPNPARARFVQGFLNYGITTPDIAEYKLFLDTFEDTLKTCSPFVSSKGVLISVPKDANKEGNMLSLSFERLMKYSPRYFFEQPDSVEKLDLLSIAVVESGVNLAEWTNGGRIELWNQYGAVGQSITVRVIDTDYDSIRVLDDRLREDTFSKDGKTQIADQLARKGQGKRPGGYGLPLLKRIAGDLALIDNPDLREKGIEFLMTFPVSDTKH